MQGRIFGAGDRTEIRWDDENGGKEKIEVAIWFQIWI